MTVSRREAMMGSRPPMSMRGQRQCGAMSGVGGGGRTGEFDSDVVGVNDLVRDRLCGPNQRSASQQRLYGCGGHK